jgi:hypothetical protein
MLLFHVPDRVPGNLSELPKHTLVSENKQRFEFGHLESISCALIQHAKWLVGWKPAFHEIDIFLLFPSGSSFASRNIGELWTWGNEENAGGREGKGSGNKEDAAGELGMGLRERESLRGASSDP